LVAAIALLVGVLGRSPLFANHSPAGAAPTATTRVPAGWRLYRDPDGYFTLAIPADWHADRMAGTATYGFRGVTVQVPTVFTRFGVPGLSIPPTALSFQITIERLVNSAQRQAACLSWRPDTIVGGLPAMSLHGIVSGWLVYTSTATYQLDYRLPDSLGNTLQSTLPTPPPQATVTAAQEQLAEIVATFRPIPAVPLSC
jgi:hypothetical protein